LSIVQYGVRNQQTFDRFSAEDVRVDDFVHVGGGNMSVPNRVGINDHSWTNFALIETPGFIRAHSAVRNSTCLQLCLELDLQLAAARWAAASAWVSLRALIGADENVFLKLCHFAFPKSAQFARLPYFVPTSCPGYRQPIVHAGAMLCGTQVLPGVKAGRAVSLAPDMSPMARHHDIFV